VGDGLLRHLTQIVHPAGRDWLAKDAPSSLVATRDAILKALEGKDFRRAFPKVVVDRSKQLAAFRNHRTNARNAKRVQPPSSKIADCVSVVE
jgi:hypothetical protein